MKKILFALAVPMLVLSLAQADDAANTAAGGKKGVHPCQQIKKACEDAGFVKGEAKEGKGLWVDCIDAVVNGTPNPKSKLALPTVDPSVIAACKAKHPKFGQAKKAHQ